MKSKTKEQPGCEKLVRDKIIEFSQQEQDGRRFRVAKESEMPDLLAKKLNEEVKEVCEEIMHSSPELQKITEELSDLMEVVNAVRAHFRISQETLNEVILRKRERKGAFEKRIVLDLRTNIPRKG